MELTFLQNRHFRESLLIAAAATSCGARKEVHVFIRICIRRKPVMMAFNEIDFDSI